MYAYVESSIAFSEPCIGGHEYFKSYLLKKYKDVTLKQGESYTFKFTAPASTARVNGELIESEYKPASMYIKVIAFSEEYIMMVNLRKEINNGIKEAPFDENLKLIEVSSNLSSLDLIPDEEFYEIKLDDFPENAELTPIKESELMEKWKAGKKIYRFMQDNFDIFFLENEVFVRKATKPFNEGSVEKLVQKPDFHKYGHVHGQVNFYLLASKASKIEQFYDHEKLTDWYVLDSKYIYGIRSGGLDPYEE